jgi:hypothetical protein
VTTADRKEHETVQIQGHIIDSLILPKVLDAITASGGTFRIQEVIIGQTRHDPSSALIEVLAPTKQQLSEILASISDHGAEPVANRDCQLAPAEIEGTFPEGFYSSTNQRTEVRLDGDWIPVDFQEMDCAIAVDLESLDARCVPMTEVVAGQEFVVGHLGVRVRPEPRASERQGFEFMNSAVSTEKPKGVAPPLSTLAAHPTCRPSSGTGSLTRSSLVTPSPLTTLKTTCMGPAWESISIVATSSKPVTNIIFERSIGFVDWGEFVKPSSRAP